jgi:serine/threonine-protein kinase
MSTTLILNEDVVIAPVGDLADDVRAQIECTPDDFAVSRTHGRSGSSIIDADSAQLLTRFREPRTVVEAVILFARERHLDPDAVLDDAYPLLRGMMERRVLVPADQKDTGEPPPRVWAAGTRLPMGVVTRTLQVLEDTEVYLLAAPDGARSVLKVERTSTPAATAALRARLQHEAALLAYLDGWLAPKLLGQGDVEGRAYLLLEFLSGTDAESAAAEWRERAREDDDGRGKLLQLANAIAGAYAKLHNLGVLHGDVHSRNVIIDREGRARLIDFGLARTVRGEPSLPASAPRGGIPFFFEPELARAFLDRSPPPPTSSSGEQFAVGALLYSIITGAHWQDFRLGREEMLRDIIDLQPRPFSDRGFAAWPELESVLGRALSKQPADRFPTMAALAAAIEVVPTLQRGPPALRTKRARAEASDRILANAALDGPWIAGLTPAPTASITYGAAGIAVGLLHVAQRRGDAQLLATADTWAGVAAREIGRESGFYNADIQITRELVGESSPYHSPSGIHVASALIARAMGDYVRQAGAMARFLEESRRPAAGLDLTLGRASTLLGAALLLDAVASTPHLDTTPLRQFGDETLAGIWRELDRKRPVAAGDVEYLGIAHGWAGFLYATLQWCRLAGTPIPSGVERRLAELAALGMPAARGLEWPWVLRTTSADQPTMPGWCNGSCGYVFLWTLASQLLNDPGYLELALGAAWNAWESPEPAGTLCCGLGGRSYSLLNLYRHTGESVWLTRARALGTRAMKTDAVHEEYAHSLYKGEFGLAVLAADLQAPEDATMPFFEPVGY